MVHLSRIYTRFGDAGQTMLGDGSTVPKTAPRVAAYGSVDEANAAIGAAVCECEGAGPFGVAARALLLTIQQDLFDIGADLCTPATSAERPGDRLRVTPDYAARLERAIDEHNGALRPLNTFVLPGGSRLAAALHVARTVVRRAERDCLALADAEPGGANRDALICLNRLSDLLFVLARRANDDGRADVLWSPGANRKA